MRIVAHLGVVDEIGLVGPALDHLYRIGVDHVIAFDRGSRDGTLELLRSRSGPALEVLSLADDTPWEAWRDATVAHVRAAHGDWVMFLDADEFWLPRNGSLRDCLRDCAADVLAVGRFNAVLGPHGPFIPERLGPECYDDLLLHCRETPNFRDYLAAHPEAAWLSGVPVPKVICKVDHFESVRPGGHDIVARADRATVRRRATGLIIAHVPISTYERFQRKLANIERFFERNPDYMTGSQGWHWRRWAAIRKQGGEEEEYRRQHLDADTLRVLRQDGAIRSAAELLAPV